MLREQISGGSLRGWRNKGIKSLLGARRHMAIVEGENDQDGVSQSRAPFRIVCSYVGIWLALM